MSSGKWSEQARLRWYWRNRARINVQRNKWWAKKMRDPLYRAAHNKHRRSQYAKAKTKPGYKQHRIALKHRISDSTYQALLQKASGRCQICLSASKLNLDHNHKTKQPRGLLCAQCNYALGFFKDSLVNLKRAIAYLKAQDSPCPQ